MWIWSDCMLSLWRKRTMTFWSYSIGNQKICTSTSSKILFAPSLSIREIAFDMTYRILKQCMSICHRLCGKCQHLLHEADATTYGPPIIQNDPKVIAIRWYREPAEIIHQLIDIYLDILSPICNAPVQSCNPLFKHFGKHSNRNCFQIILTTEIFLFSNLKFFSFHLFFKY
jgi:hypothetical protein